MGAKIELIDDPEETVLVTAEFQEEAEEAPVAATESTDAAKAGDAKAGDAKTDTKDKK